MVSAPRPRVARRWLVAALVGVVLLALVAVFVRTVVLRDSTHAVPTDEALGVFPRPVEHFDTTRIDTPDHGRRHVDSRRYFDDRRPTFCAATRRNGDLPIHDDRQRADRRARRNESRSIQPRPHSLSLRAIAEFTFGGTHLRERRDEWGLCSTPDGIELSPLGVQYHEFYNQPDEEAVSCDRSVVLIPSVTSAPAGPQQLSCTLADDPWLPRWEILERTTRSVEGTTIDVQHVRMTVDDSDEYYEHTVVDWYLAPTGLPMEMSSTKRLHTSPIGGVVYHEQCDLQLISTAPLR